MNLFKVILLLGSLSLLTVSCLDETEEDPPKPNPPQPEWIIQSVDVLSSPLNAVYFHNENSGWIAGNDGAFIYTFDGGETWSANNSISIEHLYDVFFVGPYPLQIEYQL